MSRAEDTEQSNSSSDSGSPENRRAKRHRTRPRGGRGKGGRGKAAKKEEDGAVTTIPSEPSNISEQRGLQRISIEIPPLVTNHTA